MQRECDGDSDPRGAHLVSCWSWQAIGPLLEGAGYLCKWSLQVTPHSVLPHTAELDSCCQMSSQASNKPCAQRFQVESFRIEISLVFLQHVADSLPMVLHTVLLAPCHSIIGGITGPAEREVASILKYNSSLSTVPTSISIFKKSDHWPSRVFSFKHTCFHDQY